jgi:hypothetical protein
MVELGIYSERPDIEPTVVTVGPFTEEEVASAALWDNIQDARKVAELKLGVEVPDERVFIRIFTR